MIIHLAPFVAVLALLSCVPGPASALEGGAHVR
jgi:hypothetical protein